MRPIAPANWLTPMTMPAASEEKCSSVTSQTRPNVETVNCGTTSSMETPWMRQSSDVSRYGLHTACGCAAPPSPRARGGRGGSTIPTAHSTAETPQSTAGTTSAAAIPPAAASSGTVSAAIGDAERLAHLPDAHRQPPALLREPADHDASAGRVGAGGGHPADAGTARRARRSASTNIAANGRSAVMARPGRR